MKLPLTMILKDAHKLLDDVAKDKTGRDALACRVWKPGGEQQTWAMPWDIPERKRAEGIIAHAMDMEMLVREMRQREDKKSDVGYASKLLYHFRETLKILLPEPLPKEEKDLKALAKSIEELALDKLLEASYLNSGLLDGWDERAEGKSKRAYVKEQVDRLMPLLRVYNQQGNWDGLYSSDAALLLRFLAQKGVER
jgi:CRISPR-associated protein Cmr2